MGELPQSLVCQEDRNVRKSDATKSDVTDYYPLSEEKCVRGTVESPHRRPSRIKPPIIEVVYVPTKFDPDDAKVVYDILADWILKDIEKEMKKKTSSE